MAGQAQQSAGYPGQSGLPTQSYAPGSLVECPQQHVTGMLSSVPSQQSTGFTNGPGHPNSPFASSIANGGTATGSQGPHGQAPSSYCKQYQGSQAPLHTIISSSSVHAAQVQSTGSSILQGLGSGGSTAFPVPVQVNQEQPHHTYASMQQHQQGEGQAPTQAHLGQFAQQFPKPHSATAQKPQPSGGFHPGSMDMSPRVQVYSPAFQLAGDQ
jgi:hypothetical protein